MSEQREMSHLLRECPLGFKGQEAIFKEDALSVTRLDGEATIGRIGRKGQVGPLPAQCDVV